MSLCLTETDLRVEYKALPEEDLHTGQDGLYIELVHVWIGEGAEETDVLPSLSAPLVDRLTRRAYLHASEEVRR